MKYPAGKRDSGFSLIEMLVAMVILAMTILIATAGFSLFMQKWDDELGSFDKDMTAVRQLKLVHKAMNSITPYIVTKSSGEPGVYFEGNEDNFIAVTARPVFSIDAPAAIRVRVVQADDFSYSLVYEETPLTGTPLINAAQDLAFSRQLVLLSDMSDIKVNYFGYRHLTDKISRGKPDWWKTFNGLERELMPEVVRIAFVYDGMQQSIEFSLSQLDSKMLRLFSNDF